MEKARIMVVEDEGIVALQIRTALEQRGYRVVGPYASGAETLALIRQDRPDLVLMDMKLEGTMDGIEVAERIRAGAGAPVIFLTAHSEQSTVERAKEAAPYAYILKPFDPQELAIAVEIALYKHRIDREKDELTQQLKAALERVKLLSGLLPICSSCRRVRDDAGYWTQLETYVREHSEAEFSHGLCADCAKKLYPQYFDKEEEKEDKDRHGRG